MTIEQVITQLKLEQAQIELAISALEGKITGLGSVRIDAPPLVREIKVGTSSPRAASAPPRKKEHWSTTPWGRKMLAASMKERWASGAFNKR